MQTSNITSGNGGKERLKIFGHLGAFLTVAAWGSSFIATKVLMEDGGFTPVEVFLYRFTLAYLILLIFTFKHIRSNNWRDEFQFLICGICSGSLYFITENYALQYTTAGNVSLLSALSPIFTTLLMALVFRARIPNGVIIGSVVAAVGAGCVVMSHGEELSFNPLGDLLALSSALSWAVYAILVKRLTPHYSTFFVTRKLFFYGVITALPLLLIQKEPYHLYELFDISNPTYLLNFLFLALICSLTAYILWNESMKILGPVTTNNYIYMQPLATMVIAYFLLSEKIYLLGYIGCALVIGGLIIADKLDFNKLRKK
ncbi:MAG: DMT family transporter [Muribaculaceae bacterium]|nr:DMT family transporter [Muribaculaceae bacterium]